MAEIYNQNPQLAQSLADSFLSAYNGAHATGYAFSEWDTNGNSSWDFRGIDSSQAPLEVQVIEAPPIHGPGLKEFTEFEEGETDSVHAQAIESDDIRLEAAVGRKCIEQNTGKIIPRRDTVLLVIFRHLPYNHSNLEQMRNRIGEKKLSDCFKGLWIINENGGCDQIE